MWRRYFLTFFNNPYVFITLNTPINLNFFVFVLKNYLALSLQLVYFVKWDFILLKKEK